MSNQVQRHFLKSINFNIKTVKINNKFYFNIFDLSNGLQYSSSKYLYNYYCIKCNDIKIFNQKYIEIEYVQVILNRARKPNAKLLLQEIFDITKSQV